MIKLKITMLGTEVKLNRLQTGIWILGMSLICLVNLMGVLPPMHIGVQRPVGSDVVSVVSLGGHEGGISVPIQEWRDKNREYIDTGTRVQVFLRNSYRNEEEFRWNPRITLGIALVVFFIYLILWVIKKCGYHHV